MWFWRKRVQFPPKGAEVVPWVEILKYLDPST